MSLLVSRTITFYEEEPWRVDVFLLDERGYVNSRTARFPRRTQGFIRKWFTFQLGIHLIRISAKYDAVAIGRYGIWLPVLLRLFRNHKPVVMMDVEWPKVKRGRLNRAAALGSSVLCAFTREEIDRYSRQYRIPKERFRLVRAPFEHRNLRETSDEGFIFSGGLKGRDWETLLRAVDGLRYPVRVFSKEPLAPVPSNVNVSYVCQDAFFSEMARSSLVALAVKPGPMQLTGMITWTTAMAMGKPVVVAEPLGAPDYIEHGVSGFFVDYGDADGLRKYISLLMEDIALRQQMGEAAKQRAWQDFSPDAFRRRILSLLDEAE
ncbi:MAG: glycosyltransferase [Candidatus Micrarchaeaceae archaeon]